MLRISRRACMRPLLARHLPLLAGRLQFTACTRRRQQEALRALHAYVRALASYSPRSLGPLPSSRSTAAKMRTQQSQRGHRAPGSHKHQHLFFSADIQIHFVVSWFHLQFAFRFALQLQSTCV